MKSRIKVIYITITVALCFFGLRKEAYCGGEFWHVFALFNGDLHESFQVAQESVLSSGKYNDPTKPAIIENEEEFMRMFELNRKQFDEMQERDRKQSLYASNIFQMAKTKEDKIKALRRLTGADGTRSILDMYGIKPDPEIGYISPVTKRQLIKIFGTEEPAKPQVLAKLSDIAELCDRMLGKYVIVYDNDKQIEVLFAGYSAD
jgi:hypothetical protein